MSKNKTTEPVITDELLAEINNISEKDIETLNTDKLNDLFVKTHCVLTVKLCEQHVTDLIRLAELGESIDKMETALLSVFDELSATDQLTLLRVLLKREKYLKKNAEDFKNKIPESSDNLHKFKLYYEKRAREKKHPSGIHLL